MSMFYLLQDAVTAYLRGSNLGGGFVWGENGSPAYEEFSEPPPAFPYVVLEEEDSRTDHTFGGGYLEHYRMKVSVVGLEANIEAISAPSFGGSVMNYLDKLASGNNWEVLSSPPQFKVASFWRATFGLHKTEVRAPNTMERVWIASATYESMVNIQYP